MLHATLWPASAHCGRVHGLRVLVRIATDGSCSNASASKFASLSPSKSLICVRNSSGSRVVIIDQKFLTTKLVLFLPICQYVDGKKSEASVVLKIF